MTDDQLVGFFSDVERDPMGYPKLSLPKTAQSSTECLFKRFLYLLGVTEPETVAAMWAAEVEALKEVKRGQSKPK